MYESFAAVTLLVLGLLILLARASEAMFAGTDEGDADDAEVSRIPATGAARIERHRDTGETRAERIERRVLDDDGDGDGGGPWDDADRDDAPWGENEAESDARQAREDAMDERETSEQSGERTPDEQADSREIGEHDHQQGLERNELHFSTGALLTNVAFSQGLFGAAVVGAAWLADVPLAALGVDLGDPWSVGLPAVALGVAVGVALYVANELSATVVDAAGVEYSEGLREALAPDTAVGWLGLLGVVLPVIACFEELLFRAALVGAFAAGFGLSPWLLALFSTVAFAVGHGAQGPGGVAVTGLLGFALAAAFVLTGSLLVVVVAHYLVNALEFVVHEGLGIEWARDEHL